MIVPADMKRHVQKVLDGEYDVPIEFEGPVDVIDVGANVGAFAVWASKRWPVRNVLCIEPHPDTFRTLEENTRDIPVDGDVGHVQAAVTWDAIEARLYLGKNNIGENSLHRDLGEQSDEYVVVPRLDPREMPRCQILKVDCEGSEVVVLKGYRFLHGVQLVLLETHGEDRRRTCDDILFRNGFAMVMAKANCLDRAVFGYINRSRVK